jgi:CO/xanthine dehydrogenase FAD-binding subunit
LLVAAAGGVIVAGAAGVAAPGWRSITGGLVGSGAQPLSDASIDAAAAAAMSITDPAEDLRGDIQYKTAMAGEMVKRALNKAWSLCA